MEILNRLIHLGKYLVGDFIIIDPNGIELEVDEGKHNAQKSKEVAVEFFHKTYTKDKT